MAQYTHGCPVLANHIHASKPMNTILHLNTDCGTANYRHVMKEVGFELWLVQVQTDHYTTTTICLWYIPYTPHVTVTQAYWQRVFCVGGKLISWSTFLALECSLEQVKMNCDTITCVCICVCVCVLFLLCCSEVKVCTSPNYSCKFTTSFSVYIALPFNDQWSHFLWRSSCHIWSCCINEHHSQTPTLTSTALHGSTYLQDDTQIRISPWGFQCSLAVC